MQLSKEKLAANRILNLVRSGDKTIPRATVEWALRVTGDLIGSKL